MSLLLRFAFVDGTKFFTFLDPTQSIQNALPKIRAEYCAHTRFAVPDPDALTILAIKDGEYLISKTDYSIPLGEIFKKGDVVNISLAVSTVHTASTIATREPLSPQLSPISDRGSLSRSPFISGMDSSRLFIEAPKQQQTKASRKTAKRKHADTEAETSGAARDHTTTETNTAVEASKPEERAAKAPRTKKQKTASESEARKPVPVPEPEPEPAKKPAIEEPEADDVVVVSEKPAKSKPSSISTKQNQTQIAVRPRETDTTAEAVPETPVGTQQQQPPEDTETAAAASEPTPKSTKKTKKSKPAVEADAVEAQPSATKPKKGKAPANTTPTVEPTGANSNTVEPSATTSESEPTSLEKSVEESEGVLRAVDWLERNWTGADLSIKKKREFREDYLKPLTPTEQEYVKKLFELRSIKGMTTPAPTPRATPATTSVKRPSRAGARSTKKTKTPK